MEVAVPVTGNIYVDYAGVLHVKNLSDDEKRAAAGAEYIRNLETLLAERDRLLAAIPPCPIHGSQCVPYALEWIKAAVMREHELR